MMAECACEHIKAKPNGTKGTKKKDPSDIMIHDRGTQKMATMSKRNDIMDMCEGDKWLSTKLVDECLSNLVVPDLHCNEGTSIKFHCVDMSTMKFALEQNHCTLGHTQKIERFLKNELGDPNDHMM